MQTNKTRKNERHEVSSDFQSVKMKNMPNRTLGLSSNVVALQHLLFMDRHDDILFGKDIDLGCPAFDRIIRACGTFAIYA